MWQWCGEGVFQYLYLRRQGFKINALTFLSSISKRMKTLAILLFFIIAMNYACNSSFSHDPSQAYPVLENGDYWIDKFDQRGLQNAKIFGDRLFCNTINITRGQDFLYCLNLKTGKVIWRLPINWYASQPVEIYSNEVYFSTVLGDIYKISINGELIWKQKLPSSYAGHIVNPINGNLIIHTVVDGAYEMDTSFKVIGKNHY